MRRAVLALILTVVALALLLTYHSPPPVLDALEPHPARAPFGATTSTLPITRFSATEYVGRKEIADQPKIGWAFGEVQVEAVVDDGRLVQVDALHLPPQGDTGGAGTTAVTTSISNLVAPILEREAIVAQSAEITTVTGATYTCDAFIDSLENALLKARS